MRIRFILLIVVLFTGTCFAQSNVSGSDTLIKQTAFKQKNYRKFEKKYCDAEKYDDSMEAKDLLCKAGYFISLKENRNSIACLKQAFVQGYSVEFKFQVLKLLVENYKQLGFTEVAQTYQDRLDQVREAYPDIEKESSAK